MINEALKYLKGISINGVNITNLRYADDAALVSDSKKKLQRMLDRLNASCYSCKAYGMSINVKKTKLMVISKEEGVKGSIKRNEVELEQVSRYKYLGSLIMEDGRCEEELKARIAMAQAAFWQNKEIMRRNIRKQTKLKQLNCYVFSVLNYGCESWTWNKAMQKKIDAFEVLCYRRMFKISWKDKMRNEEVLRRAQTKLHFLKNMKKEKLNMLVTC
jgi:hypothetical protein